MNSFTVLSRRAVLGLGLSALVAGPAWAAKPIKVTAEQAEANGGTESTEAEDQADAEGGEALNLGNTCEIFHFSSERTD